MIQLRKSGVIADREDVERLKPEFQERHCVLLPKLLEPALLNFLMQRLQQGAWRDKEHKGIGTEVVLEDSLALSTLHFLANAPRFIEAVRGITGCAEATWFGGRVYRFIPNSDHHDTWHSDTWGTRLVGMSLNLSPNGYKGGLFQMREKASQRLVMEVANTGVGDATLFRISERLDHQVTRVEGEQPKTAFAGWFQSGEPTFRDRLLMAREAS